MTYSGGEQQMNALHVLWIDSAVVHMLETADAALNDNNHHYLTRYIDLK